MFPEDIHDFPQTVISLMQFHRFRPDKISSVTFFYVVKTVMLYMLMVLWIIAGNLAYLCKFYWEPTVDVSDNVIAIFEGSFFLYTFLAFLPSLKKTVVLVNELGDFREFGKPPNLDKFKRQHNIAMKILYVYCALSCVLYGCMGLIYEEKHINKNKRIACQLIVPILSPVDLNDFTKKILVVLEMVCLSSATLGAVVGTFFGVTCMDLITIRIKHLNAVLKTIPNLPNDKHKEKITWCVRYQIHIIRLTKCFNDCTRNVNAAHFTLSSIIVGILNFLLFQKMQPKELAHLLGWLSTLFLLCYSGQNIINKSTSLSNTLYFLNWYDYDPEVKYYIRMMIMRSQIPLSIAAGIFYSYSFELLSAILQASYSYMTLMTRLNSIF